MPNPIIILGPTAVGKTKYSIDYAKEHAGEIISADSMQVYRGMDIGTAKPSEDERKEIPHHLIDIRNPDEEWTVSDFVNETNKLIPEIQGRGKLPIIVGGTGLYLWALTEGFKFPIVPRNKNIREKLEKLPLTTLHSRLSTLDKTSAQKIHPNDKKRIIRALEVYELTGKPISKLQKKGKEPRVSLSCSDYALIGLNMDRDKLYQRIEQRVDKMLEKGLVAEVKALLGEGYNKDLQSMQALGYKEVIDYLENKYSYDEVAAILKKKTRNFARRQLVWFRRFNNVNWISM